MAMDDLGEDCEIGPELWHHTKSRPLVGLRLTSVKHYAHSCNKVGEYAPGRGLIYNLIRAGLVLATLLAFFSRYLTNAFIGILETFAFSSEYLAQVWK